MVNSEITLYLDDATCQRLHRVSKDRDMPQKEICENLISEGLLDYFRHYKNDPGRTSTETIG